MPRHFDGRRFFDVSFDTDSVPPTDIRIIVSHPSMLSDQERYIRALKRRVENGTITKPGTYEIHIDPDTLEYEIIRI